MMRTREDLKGISATGTFKQKAEETRQEGQSKKEGPKKKTSWLSSFKRKSNKKAKENKEKTKSRKPWRIFSKKSKNNRGLNR